MFMKKRVLIPYATYGSGHKSVAFYIKDYLESHGDYECLTMDLINYSFPIVGKLSKTTNEFLMTKLPSIWSLIYFSFENKISSYLTGNLSLKIFNNKKLIQDIKEFNPDITIATHFFGSDLINKYNKRGITNSKLITVVTDYKSHDYWLKVVKGTDALIVSSLEEKFNLIKKGYKSSQIHTSGIPILANHENLNKDKLRKKYKINNNKKTILFFVGGGNGALYNLIYFKEILKNNYDCNVLFISGKNKKAMEKATEYVKRYNSKNAHVFGFVNTLNELYYISDFVITKPGGIQVTECLFFEKPMLLVKGNGGQEIENRIFLCKKGYARWAKSKLSFNRNFKKMLNDDNDVKEKIRNIKKVNSKKSMEKLFDIVEKMK